MSWYEYLAAQLDLTEAEARNAWDNRGDLKRFLHQERLVRTITSRRMALHVSVITGMPDTWGPRRLALWRGRLQEAKEIPKTLGSFLEAMEQTRQDWEKAQKEQQANGTS